jgi:hypothetical protein
VASQALFMLNSELVDRAAESLALGVRENGSERDAAIEQLYLRVYGRAPRLEQRARAASYLARFRHQLELDELSGADLELSVWSALSHTILMSNEFLYVP